jgi:uncharacterized protein YjiS (DUF1127 family)
MSIYSHQSMTNHHSTGIFNQLADVFHLWRDRRRQRRELSHWTDRDLHDVGISWSDVVREAEKPFWRA